MLAEIFRREYFENIFIFLFWWSKNRQANPRIGRGQRKPKATADEAKNRQPCPRTGMLGPEIANKCSIFCHRIFLSSNIFVTEYFVIEYFVVVYSAFACHFVIQFLPSNILIEYFCRRFFIEYFYRIFLSSNIFRGPAFLRSFSHRIFWKIFDKHLRCIFGDKNIR